MTLTNCYATVSELQQELGREQKITDEKYTFLEDCIRRATKYIEDNTGNFYYQATLSNEIVDIYGESNNGFIINYAQDSILTPPIVSITSIIEDGIILTKDEDYYLFKNYGKIMKNAWSSGHNAIVITGVFGYSSTPENIKNLCVKIAAIFSGLATKIVSDGNGGELSVNITQIPEWILNELYKERRIYV